MIKPGPRTIYLEYGPNDEYQFILWDEGGSWSDYSPYDYFTFLTKAKDSREEPPEATDGMMDELMSHAPENIIVLSDDHEPLFWDGSEFRRATVAEFLRGPLEYDIDHVLAVKAVGFNDQELHDYLSATPAWPKAQVWADWATVSDDEKLHEWAKERAAAMTAAREVLGKFGGSRLTD